MFAFLRGSLTWISSLRPFGLVASLRPFGLVASLKIDFHNPSKHLVQQQVRMSFATNIFSDLSASYPNWDALRMYLMSAEGGKLRVMSSDTDDLAIIRYTKGVSDFSKSHVRWFRSVVWNKVTNAPVAVAPVKAEKGNAEPCVTLRVSDFVDGTMINAFRTEQGVRLATRTSLDAKGTFYSTRSFAELFGDAFRPLGGWQVFLESVLKVGQFVSFVLQHPEHMTVLSIAQPRVYVAYFGSINAEEATMTSLPSEWPERLAAFAPQVYEEGAIFEAHGDSYKMMREQKLGYSWQGLVFQEVDGSRRWRIRNPAYTAVRSLRGSESNPMERFLRLRNEGTVKKYLEHFRDESNQMWEFEKTLRERTGELYTAYTDMNKLKTKTMKQLPYCLRPHVYALHGLYLSSLPKDGTRAAPDAVKPVLKETVVGYVNRLALEEQLKLLQGDRVPLSAASLSAAAVVAAVAVAAVAPEAEAEVAVVE